MFVVGAFAPWLDTNDNGLFQSKALARTAVKQQQIGGCVTNA
ncbi:hypothetical protein [Bradyrhizobium icense]|nr:hypothetical protein [Bradyrhizobium icense]